MSDDRSKDVPHEGQAGNCDVPGCAYHAMANAKVKAVKVDGLVYVEIEDLATLVTAIANWNLHLGAQEIVERGQVDSPFAETAVTNFLAGAKITVDLLQQLHSSPISTLDDEATYLVSPEATKPPEEIPTEWMKWMEKVKRENEE